MEFKLKVVLAFALFTGIASAQTPAVPNVYVAEEDVSACVKAATPCTIWTPESLARFQRVAYDKGVSHGREQMLLEIKAQFEADQAARKEKATR